MTNSPIQEFAPAKINLTLHVTGQRGDGYHLLDSLVVFADIGDRLRIAPLDRLSLNVTGPMRAGVPMDDSNLVLRAAHLLVQGEGAQITLEKHLPNAAGIGGGSSDAAAALRGLARLWGVPLPDDPARLGADVPACLLGRALRMQGIGEVVTPLAPLPEVWAVLVNPRVSVPTPEVFRRLEAKTNAPMPKDIPGFADASELADWCADQRNDLENPATQSAPVIAEVLEALSPAMLARMSGSGATCFGLMRDEASAMALAKTIRQEHPNWWVVSARLS